MTNFTWTDKQNNVDDVMAEDINSIAHAVQEINSKAGDLNYLNTTDKSNLVNAVNEINTRATDIEAEIEEINGRVSFVMNSNTINDLMPVGAVQFVGESSISTNDPYIPDSPIYH